MRIKKFLSIVAVSIFLIGTQATANALAQGWKPPVADHEVRIGDLETNDAAQDNQLADHETRIGDLETNETAQDSQLSDHETRIGDTETRLDELQEQIGQPAGIKVFDSSDLPQFVGILVGIYPAGYKPSAGYEVGAMFTVYIPDLGKFIELNRTGEVIESRFRFEYLYYKVDGCDSSGGTYAIPESDEVVDPAFISAHWFVDPNIGYIWSYYKVGDQQTAWLESRHTGVIGTCDDSPSGNYGAIPLTEVTLPFTLPLTPPLSFQ